MAELTAEVFATGKWNGMAFTLEDLKGVVTAFQKLSKQGDRLRVPLKMGHNDKQPMTDGHPALGWVEDVWLENEVLMARFTGMPDIVFKAVEAGLYRNVSIEMNLDVKYKGDYFPYVLTGVALLGADLPAVNTLADLSAYMTSHSFSQHQSGTVKFSVSDINVVKFSQENSMANEDIAALKAELQATREHNARLIEDNVALRTAQAEQGAKFKVFEAAENQRKLNEQRKALFDKLEVLVKDRKIAPSSRDGFLRDFDDTNNKDAVVFAVEQLEKVIDANPSYYGAEQARMKAEKDRSEQNQSATQVVLARTNEYMTKHGEKSFSVAQKAVLKADPELATRYVKMEG